jgi:hypothetical protein
MPLRYKVGKLYWWKAYEGMKVLVSLIQETEGHVSVRIMTISEAAVLRTSYGAGQLVYLDKRTAPLEEVNP